MYMKKSQSSHKEPITRSDALRTLSQHGVMLCVHWASTEWCFAYTEPTRSDALRTLSLHGVMLCVHWANTEWCFAYTEPTRSETRFSNEVKKSVQNSKIHWVNPQLCTARTKSTQSNALNTLSHPQLCIANTESTQSNALHTPSQRRVMHCIQWVNAKWLIA